jgi:uncharacterized protein (DUF58 family)
VNIRTRIVLILFVLSLFGGIATGWDTYYALAYVWGGTFFISLIWSRVALTGIKVERRPRSLRAQVGRTYEEIISLENTSRIGKLWLELRDLSDLPGHRASSVTTNLGRRQSREWLVRTICTLRGRFRIGPIELHSGDPFGFFPQMKKFDQEFHILVLPKTEPIRNFPFPSGRLPGGDALRQRTHQVTPNASGVRDYVPGDSLNRIHWRSTARLRRLIAKEFEFDPQAEVWIILDADSGVQYGGLEERSPDLVAGVVHGDFELPRSTEEYAVAIAASLTMHLAERDRAVGFISHGRARHVLQSDRGEAQLFHILESLAVLEAKGPFSLKELLKIEGPRIPRGASVVAITPSVEPSVLSSVHELKRSGLSPVLVLLNSQSFGGVEGSRRIANAAHAEGIPVRFVSYGDSITEALSKRSLPQTIEPMAA